MANKTIFGICLILSLSGLLSPAESASDVSLRFLKKIDIGSGARPEVVATKDRVFVVYLDTAKEGSSAYSVKIYDREMSREISYKVLVAKSSSYGRPTDIRVTSDGKFLYTFYELTDNAVSYLFGAKYALDDNFERAAYTSSPIAQGPAFNKENIGDEIINDPIILLGPDSVFAITRIKQRSFSKEEPTVYRVREMDYNFGNIKPSFDLDISRVAGGEARQASALYYDNHYYLVAPRSTKSGNYPESMMTPSDLIYVKLDRNWKIVESKSITQDPDDIETFILGFKAKGDRFFVTYKQRKGDSTFVCPLNVYDRNFNLISSTIVKQAASRRESLRATVEVTDDRILVGISVGEGPAPPGLNGKKGFNKEDGSRPPFPQRGRDDFMQRDRMRKSPPSADFSQDKRGMGNVDKQRAEIYIYTY